MWENGRAMPELVHRLPHIAVLLHGSQISHTQILRGILRYAQSHAPWTLDVRVGRAGELATFDEASWRFDGVVAGFLPPGLERLARRHRTPIVLMNDLGETMRPVARIKPDNASMARMAAEFFAGRGFVRFAYIGATGTPPWSVERGEAFAAEAALRGISCDIYPGDDEEDPGGGLRLGDWLLALPRPAALFAANDLRARGVLDACARAGIVVPNDMALLGVDNDEVFCDTSSPTLSSIAMATEEAGYRTAGTLDAAMSGHRCRTTECETIFYAAKAVVERRSTAHDASRDELVRRCRALVEANIATHFTVADLAHGLHVSRRTLETRFRMETGHSPGDEIVEQRIRRAKALLAQTHMSQSQIAAACGFTDASHMNVVFHRLCGAVPSAFR